MTHAELVNIGLMEVEETWYHKKMMAYAADIRGGLFGEVLKEWIAGDGWGDGFKSYHFVLLRGEDAFVAKANESGVFKKCFGGGWVRIEKI